ncbi:cytochrome P450 [Azospirillum thermophilum]|uniref:cytochrome P450 n=1 Tax=Azospirillum thermophilum TaxID=2202148 RepID=UPI001B3BD031|nr:cytochrome P450 [Azospirillum thermophilum]
MRAPHPPGAWPPGPRSGLTGWGLLKRMSRDLPGTLAAWKREFGDVVHLRIWPEHQVVVTDPALVRELLVGHHDALIRWERGMRVFTGLQGRSVFTAEGESWRVRRHALQPAFQPGAVQAFVPAMAAAAAAAQALAGWPAGGASVAVESAFTAVTMEVILRMVFSGTAGDDARLAADAVPTLLRAANAELYWPASWPDRMPWKRTKRRSLAMLRGMVDRHVGARLRLAAEDWPDDLLTRLLRLHRDDAASWPLRTVGDECMTIILAGHETAAATLAWWAWCMAANPAAQADAREEVRRVLGGRPPAADDLPALRLVTQTLKETMRLYPAAPVLNSRRITRPITLGPWHLPARTMVLVPVQAIQHDPRWFPEPLAFRPERFAPGAPAVPRGAYLPFGAGPRICLGQHLAMAEMTVIAAMVLQRVVLSVPAGMAPPRPVMALSLRPDRPLHLALSPVPTGD